MIATDAIEQSLPYLKPGDLVYRALDLMADNNLNTLPVVNKGKLEGLVSEEILLNVDDQAKLANIEKTHLEAFVLENDHVLDVLKVMEEWQLPLLPVIDVSDNYKGVITPKSLLTVLSRKSWVMESGGILVLEVKASSYSFAEIARIMESNDATVLYMDTALNKETEMVEVTLKLNKTDLKDILQALERFSFEVRASYHISTHDDSLKDRYDSLMMYLNV